MASRMNARRVSVMNANFLWEPINWASGTDFNDPKRESFHQSWDDAKLIWNGTVDSEMMMIELKSF